MVIKMLKRFVALLVVCLGYFGVIQFVHLPSQEVGAAGAVQEVQIAASAPELICPGSVHLNTGEGGGSLDTFAQSGMTVINAIDEGKEFSNSIVNQINLTGAGIGSANFNAVQSQTISAPSAFGLAAASCMPGISEGWLNVGDNSIGREGLLVLVNTTNVDATVSLEILGVSGEIQGASLDGLSVPANKTTTVTLASFAPKAATYSVHVTCRGAKLGIYLQSKTVRGTTPGGLDLVAAASGPTNKVLVPGVFLRGVSKLDQLIAANADYGDLAPVLRITTPGSKQATFTAQILGADGESFGTVIQSSVTARSSKDFVIEDLTDGNYIVQIDSDQPVLASLKYSRISGTKVDFAWATQVGSSKLDAGFTVPVGSISKLSIANQGDHVATVKISGKTFEVQASANIVIDVVAGRSYKIQSNLEVAASLVVDRNGSIAVVPVVDYSSTAGNIKMAIR